MCNEQHSYVKTPMIQLDFAAGVLTLIGVWLVGDKNRYGFCVAICSNILWILYVLINDHTYGIILECIPLMILNIRNFIKWRN